MNFIGLHQQENRKRKPPFFPSLGELSADHCPKLLKLPACFRSLKELQINCSYGIKHTIYGEVGEIPHPHKLSVLDCPKLRKLPTLLPSLVQLHLQGCLQLLALPRLPLLCKLRLEMCDEILLINNFGLHSLTSLYICKN